MITRPWRAGKTHPSLSYNQSMFWIWLILPLVFVGSALGFIFGLVAAIWILLSPSEPEERLSDRKP